MKGYSELLHIIKEQVDDVEQWLWIAEDWEGYRWPKEDWQNAIKVLIQKHVRKFGVVVQAGGLQGMYPRLLSDMFERVYTFEPDPMSFHCLVNNCQKDNIVKLQAAVGETFGLIDVNRFCSHNVGMNNVVAGNKYPMLTIDSLCLDDCSFMQLDVEGFELAALRGAKNTIEKYKPVICLETRIGTEKPVDDYMKSIGYYEMDKYHHDSFYVFGGSLSTESVNYLTM